MSSRKKKWIVQCTYADMDKYQHNIILNAKDNRYVHLYIIDDSYVYPDTFIIAWILPPTKSRQNIIRSLGITLKMYDVYFLKSE